MLDRGVNSDKSWQWFTTFVGQEMQHNYWLYYIIDRLMAANVGIGGIVEIGTGCGALTSFLGLWGIRAKIPVLSFDKYLGRCDSWFLEKLGVEVWEGSEYASDTIRRVQNFVKGRKVLMVCDGGDKIWEFRIYGMLVSVGSLVCVHDWGVECNYDAIRDYVNNFFEKVGEDHWKEMNVQLAVFRKVK